MQTDISNSPLARQLAREALEAAEIAAQRWIEFIDLIRGDADLEDDDPAEDNGDAETAVWLERTDQSRAPLPKSTAHFQAHEDAEDDDPGGGNVEDEGEDIDEREPDVDAEIETWSHPDDHPAELFIGRRWMDDSEPPEAA
jgi:hypothetical protein